VRGVGAESGFTARMPLRTGPARLVRSTLVRITRLPSGSGPAIPHGAHESTCPVRALQAWLAAAAIEDVPVFRSMNRHGRVFPERLSDHAVALVVKRYAELAGLDSVALAGHSLRAGFVTSAARAGEPERRIMRQTGHRSVEMVLRYVRSANMFSDNAAVALGL
jgi:integrase